MSSQVLVGHDEANENVKKVSSSFTIFLVVVIIVLFFVIAVFITNTVFFGEIRKQGCGMGMSQAEANVMFWLNLTSAIITGILILVAIFYIFFARTNPVWTQKFTGIIGYQPGTAVEPYTQRLQAGVRGFKAGYQQPEAIDEYLFLRRAEDQVRGEIAAREAQRQVEIESLLQS